MQVDDFVRKEAKRLAWFDMCDSEIKDKIQQYTVRLLGNYGNVTKSALHFTKNERLSETHLRWIIENVQGSYAGYPMPPKDMEIVKGIITKLVNRKGTEERRKSDNVKPTTIELTKNGHRALERLKKQSNASYSLVVETLLLDEIKGQARLKDNLKTKSEKIRELQGCLNTQNEKMRSLEAHVSELEDEKQEMLREIENLRDILDSATRDSGSLDASTDMNNDAANATRHIPVNESNNSLGEPEASVAEQHLAEKASPVIHKIQSDNDHERPGLSALLANPYQSKRLNRLQGVGKDADDKSK